MDFGLKSANRSPSGLLVDVTAKAKCSGLRKAHSRRVSALAPLLKEFRAITASRSGVRQGMGGITAQVLNGITPKHGTLTN